MQLSQLEGFLAITRHGKLTQAAEELHITQPTLTARIHALEKSVRARLFVRGPRGMELTEAGRAFVVYAERASAALDEGARFVSEMGSGRAGQLVIGAVPSVSSQLLPDVLRRFVPRHPEVRLDIRTGQPEKVLSMALNREIDIGIARELRHPDIENHMGLYEDRVLLVAHPDHPLARRRSIALEDLAGSDLIVSNRLPAFFDLTSSSLDETKLHLDPHIRVDDLESAKRLVELGVGVAFFPEHFIASTISTGALQEISITDAIPASRAIVAMRRRGLGPPAGPIVSFLETLHEELTESGAAARRSPTVPDYGTTARTSGPDAPGTGASAAPRSSKVTGAIERS